MKNNSLILIGITLLLGACAPKINYLGNSYTPTQQVEIFFDEKDIKGDYRVMGMIDNEGDDFEEDDPEIVQQAMVEKAKAVGADAILFTGFYNRVVTENNTQVSTLRVVILAILISALTPGQRK